MTALLLAPQNPRGPEGPSGLVRGKVFESSRLVVDVGDEQASTGASRTTASQAGSERESDSLNSL